LRNTLIFSLFLFGYRLSIQPVYKTHLLSDTSVIDILLTYVRTSCQSHAIRVSLSASDQFL